MSAADHIAGVSKMIGSSAVVRRPSGADLRDLPAALLDYFGRIWRDRRLSLAPPMDGIRFSHGIARVVLHREGRHQAELLLFPPGCAIEPHRHPRVESIDVVVAGSFEVHHGHPAADGGVARITPIARRSGVSRWFGRTLAIASHRVHSGSAGPLGACVLSVQQWADGTPPTHIRDDWQAAGNASRTPAAPERACTAYPPRPAPRRLETADV